MIAQALWKAYDGSDATLAEINPLVITGEGQLLAVDGKMVLDDNALFRHPDLEKLRDEDEDQEAEIRAREHGLSYIKLGGRYRMYGQWGWTGDDHHGYHQTFRG